MSNWQSRGKTMARTILVEYLIEYHSSVLIKLDRRGQQTELLPQMLFFFFFGSGTIRGCRIRKFT